MDVRRMLVVGPGIARPGWAEIVLRVVIATGLVIDAYVHFDLASVYDANEATISQGDLFRIEAVIAAIAAALILLVRGRLVAMMAFGVAAGGLGAVLLYRYYDVGELGPLPNMYEPIWYDDKTLSAWAEGIAAAAALALLVLIQLGARRALATTTTRGTIT